MGINRKDPVDEDLDRGLVRAFLKAPKFSYLDIRADPDSGFRASIADICVQYRNRRVFAFY